MTSWTDIYNDVDGSPIRGSIDEFSETHQFFHQMAESAQEVLDEFSAFERNSNEDRLDGGVATAFREYVLNVNDSLTDLPEVSRDAATAFKNHLTTLESLHSRADTAWNSALARARTAWNDKNTAADALGPARTWQNTVDAQLEELDNDPDADPVEHSQTADTASDAAQRVADLEADYDEAVATLDAIRGEWTELREEENDANDLTIGVLEDIGFGSLEDPGRFESLMESACEFVAAVVDFVLEITGLDILVDLLEALITGDWATLLWKLKEMLDTILLVLAVVALFCPLTAPFVILAFALSVAALVVNVALYETQWPNPQTGKTVGMGDVLLSALGVVLGAGGAAAAFSRGAGSPALLVNLTGRGGPSVLGSLRTALSPSSSADDAFRAMDELGFHLGQGGPIPLGGTGLSVPTSDLYVAAGLGFGLQQGSDTVAQLFDGRADETLAAPSQRYPDLPPLDTFRYQAQNSRFPSVFDSPFTPQPVILGGP